MPLEYDEFEVEIEFVDKALGPAPASKELVKAWLRGRGVSTEDAEELAKEIEERLPEEVEEQITTVFERDKDGKPCIHERHIKGFLKEASRALGLSGIPGFVSFIAHNVRVEPNLMPIADSIHGSIERAGHVMGARGPRSILSKSEYVEKGKAKFTVKVLKPIRPERNVGKCYQAFIENIEEIFKAGETIGMLKDRAMGYGKFKATVKRKADQAS